MVHAASLDHCFLCRRILLYFNSIFSILCVQNVFAQFGGNVHTWVYSSIAGIDTAVNGSTAGWAHILFRPAPQVIERLGTAAAAITTRFGNASISWACTDQLALALNVTIPPGCTAEVHVPQLTSLGGKTVSIADNGVAVWKAGAFVPGMAGVESGSVVTDRWQPVPSVVLLVKQGTYAFKAAK
eukprot:SAG31_NODE_2062_length_6536_cov_8.777691_6_plen_184_part_00